MMSQVAIAIVCGGLACVPFLFVFLVRRLMSPFSIETAKDIDVGSSTTTKMSLIDRRKVVTDPSTGEIIFMQMRSDGTWVETRRETHDDPGYQFVRDTVRNSSFRVPPGGSVSIATGGGGGAGGNGTVAYGDTVSYYGGGGGYAYPPGFGGNSIEQEEKKSEEPSQPPEWPPKRDLDID